MYYHHLGIYLKVWKKLYLQAILSTPRLGELGSRFWITANSKRKSERLEMQCKGLMRTRFLKKTRKSASLPCPFKARPITKFCTTYVADSPLFWIKTFWHRSRSGFSDPKSIAMDVDQDTTNDLLCLKQCCGSGSKSISTFFWASWIRIH